MSRVVAAVGAIALAATLSLPATTTLAGPLPAASTELKARARLQPVDTSVKGTITAVTPDVAYTTDQGGRVEVYTSAGDSDGGLDWRSVNQFAYLVDSVPAYKHVYATVFNSLYDYGSARLVNGKYQFRDAAGDPLAVDQTFRPSLAFLKQVNQYPTAAEARAYVHVLGAKRSMQEAFKAGSTLASLLKASGVMKYCSSTSTGACLTTGKEDADALMHSKYALFEQAKDSTGTLRNHVIWVTSANLNGSSGGRKSNTSIALYGDTSAYTKLRDIVWDAEHDQERMTTAYKAIMNTGITGANSDFSFFPSPRDVDAEANTLAAAANVAGKTQCKAYLVHSLFNNARTGLLPNLKKLQDQGCNVKIVLGENAISDIVDSYFGMSTDAREMINRVEFGNVHDKAITVSYAVGGVTHGTTWGGSANANGTSLDHDELAFRAADITVTRAVEQQLERMYQLARGGKTTEPVTGLSIDPATAQINVGSTRVLRPRISPASATVKTVTWESSNSGVASVDANTGKVTAVAPGTATITATSLSGARTATSTVVVANDQAESGQPPADQLVVDTPPTLSMDSYQQTVSATGDASTTDVVVTWGSGGTDLSGTVALQYYNSGDWKTRTQITVTNGRGKKSLRLSSSRAWRLAAKSVSSPSGARLTADAKYSNGYAYNIVKTRENSIKPRVYAPTMARYGDLMPFFATWKNPSSRYPTTLRLQYLTRSSGWRTKLTFTIARGGTQKMISVPAGSTRRWRIATATSARPKGSPALVSSSVYVKIR